jgi:phosphohistidine swiveling domain-containing protein
MQLTEQRKDEIVDLILRSSNAISALELNISHHLFANNEEKNFVREKLSKYTEVLEILPAIWVKDLKAMLNKAKETNPELKKEMQEAVKKEMSFVERNSSFISTGALVALPLLAVGAIYLPPIIAAAITIPTAIGLAKNSKTLLGSSDSTIDIDKKMKLELKALLNYELSLSNEKENTVQIKNNVEKVMDKMRNLGNQNKSNKPSF